MSTERKHFKILSLPELLLGCFVFSSVFLLIVPVSSFILEFFIGWNFVFSIVLIMLGLYSCKLESLSMLPGLLICSTLNRIAIGFQIVWAALIYRHDFLPSELHLGFIEPFLSGNLIVDGIKATILILITFFVLIALLCAMRKGITEEQQSVFQGVRLAFILMGMELVVSLISTILVGLSHFDSTAHTFGFSWVGFNLRNKDLIFTEHSRLFFYLLSVEAVSRTIPILLQSMGIAMMLVAPKKQQAIANIAFEEVMQYPYALLLAGAFLLLLAIASVWYSFTPFWILGLFSVTLCLIALSIFLAEDVQRQLDDEEKVKILRQRRQEFLQRVKNFFHRK